MLNNESLNKEMLNNETLNKESLNSRIRVEWRIRDFIVTFFRK
jgi:hypothetical protein